MAIFKGVFALQSYPEYLDFFRRCNVLTFFMLWPIGPHSRRSVGDSHSLWHVVHCSPPPPVLQGPEHRSRRVRAGVCLGGDSTALPTRSAGSWAILCPAASVPARAPLLARLGILACEAVSLSPAVHSRLPVFPRVPFLTGDLACLAFAVQMKVVSSC